MARRDIPGTHHVAMCCNNFTVNEISALSSLLCRAADLIATLHHLCSQLFQVFVAFMCC